MRLLNLPLLLVFTSLSACGGGGSSSTTTSSSGWTRTTANPLIVPTLTSTTLDFGPADPAVIYDAEDKLWKVWFATTENDLGTQVKSGCIKYAESSDGVSWSTPVIALSVASDPNAWDHTAVETPTVIKNPDPMAATSEKFMLWYSGANTSLAASQKRPTTFPYYQIGLAYSTDGKAFTRVANSSDSLLDGLVLSASAAVFGTGLPGVYGDGLVSDPAVIYKDSLFQMWFSSYAESVPSPLAASGRIPLAFGISQMTSSDGIHWNASHNNPLPTLYKPGDVSGGQQPSVIFNTLSNQYEMWFSNDTAAEKASLACSFNTVVGFWHATSVDGITWSSHYANRDFSYDPGLGYEQLGLLTGVAAVWVENQRHLFYSAWGTERVPDPSLFKCPDQQGKLITGVITLNHAVYAMP